MPPHRPDDTLRSPHNVADLALKGLNKTILDLGLGPIQNIQICPRTCQFRCGNRV
jgi:hypothetical protein